MSSGNDLAEELVALKSIYENDLKYDGSVVVITLFPCQEEKKQSYVQVDLCVTCSELYPKKEPEVSLKNIKGLSDNLIQILYGKLKKVAETRKGEVMIFNLACCVQDFLFENNKPGKKSCYEEMLLRKEQQKQEEEQVEVNKKAKLRENIRQKQQKMLQSGENDSSDDEKFERSNSTRGRDQVRSNSVIQVDKTPCEHRGCRYIQFNNKVLRGCCVLHDTSSIIYCAIDNTTGDQLFLREWVLKPDQKIRPLVEEKLNSIQNNLTNFKKLCHENLISYIDFKWYSDKDEYVVHVLQECVTGVNLCVFIERSVDLDVDFIKIVASGVLNALDYLHDHDIVHGCLSGSVYYSKLGIIKIADYGIKKLIDNLHQTCKYEESFQSDVDYSPKSDIIDVGYLLLRMMKMPSLPNANVLVPDFQPPELKEFIEKCLIENEETRWTARKLLNHKFLKVKESRLNVGKKKLSRGESLEVNSENSEKRHEIFLDVEQNPNSRLSKEFVILKHIGSGSFGNVLKVKNKLDGNVYAIKEIRLNTKQKQLDRKMVREVKLLSKLNHENVVRYYTSWIETDLDNEATKSIDDVDSRVSINKSNLINESEDENDDDEEEEEEDDDDDEMDGPYGNCVRGETEQSSYITFEKGASGENSHTESEHAVDKSLEPGRHFYEPNKIMYIQMEFCEKSTLRIAINDTASLKLCEDETRLWRLFREIVEGLAYVHEQGMIHRDLKPENIFLDSSDHVKIGDFGLATISVVSKCFLPGVSLGAGDNDASSHNIYDDFHTGKVGTSLYVAPELDKTFEKSHYNQKVDLYSLGIIFFEMCNGPFGTDMERIETILNIRKPEIILPPCWEEKVSKQRKLVKMLLNHDPKSRPYCLEILEDYLPPAEVEYGQFQDVIRQTLTDSKSKAYKYLVSSCFDQEVRIEDDITYQWEKVRTEKQHIFLDLVKDRLEKIMKKHGAIYLSTPLLLPENKEFRNIETRVQLMTHSGSIVNLPYDLRISFARYVACKGFSRLRRYVVERVYREKKIHGLHPKEQYECAFDLVTPSSGIENAQLEVFSVIQEIVNDFKSLKNRNCVIRLNHSCLLKALLIHFNSEKWYTNIFKILADSKENKNFKSKLETNLQQLGIPSVNILVNLFTKEDSFSNIKKELISMIYKRGKALDVMNEAFEQLAAIIGKAEKLGIKVPIKIALGVVCNSEHCFDLMFDVVYQVKQKKKKEETIVVMSGCRYGQLVTKFRRLFELIIANPGEDSPSAVGVSVYLDKIAAVLKEDNILSEYVVVCGFGNNVSTRTKESMAKRLWDCGIQCYVEETIQSLEELTDYCRENTINHIVNVKEEESGIAYVMTWNNDKNHYQEKKVNIREVPEYIFKYSKTSDGLPSPLFSRHLSEPQGKPDFINGNQNINLHVLVEEKLIYSASQRKRWESQLRTRTSTIAGFFSPRIRLEVVGVFLDEQKVNEIAFNFNKSKSSSNFIGDAGWMTDRSCDRNYVMKICTKLQSLFSDNSNIAVILYSLLKDKYQVILES